MNPTEYIIEEVQAGEDIIRMRNGCFLAMSRKLSVNQRITISGKNEYRFFFQNHCYFLNTENLCRCKNWVRSYLIFWFYRNGLS